MPKKPRKPTPVSQRDYDKEYARDHSSPKDKKARAERNRARAKAKKAGKVKKGDRKEVHHSGAKGRGGLGKNTRVVSRRTNRQLG